MPITWRGEQSQHLNADEDASQHSFSARKALERQVVIQGYGLIQASGLGPRFFDQKFSFFRESLLESSSSICF